MILCLLNIILDVNDDVREWDFLQLKRDGVKLLLIEAFSDGFIFIEY
jgi:hypothetical protein